MSVLPEVVQRLRRFVAARLDAKRRVGLYLTIMLLIACLALWAFGALLDAVLDNATMVRLDTRADAAIHARVTSAGLAFFKAVTHLGDPRTIVVLGLAGVVVLWLTNHRTTLVAWIAAFAGAGLLDGALKLAVHRDRPAYGAQYLHGDSFSFPSGHSMGIVVGVGMVLYTVNLFLQPPRWARRVSIAIGGLIVLLVGVSRVYLGVHYPSDVLGGYAAAAGWIAACISVNTVVRERREGATRNA